MDFGAVGVDGLVGSDNGFASDSETRQKWYGSGFLKQERSGTTEDDWRGLKMAKTEDFSAPKAMLQRSASLLRSNTTLFSDGHQPQQMLSFSSPKSEAAAALVERSSQSGSATTVPFFHHTSAAYCRNTGFNSGNSNAANLVGLRGPFTPSQWMELEHQALIYKYITANVPIPSNLLIPIRRALDSAGFSFAGSVLRPNPLGWGSFHLGLSNSTDPEPGRCRRTDGKKWRCSRDAVADQKYCERHMNRGRHRSRKPVEGQTGRGASGPTTTTATTTTTKLMPIAASTSASVVSGGVASNCLANVQHQVKNLQPSTASNPPAATHINRIYLNKENMDERMQDASGLSMLPPTIDLKSKEPFSLPKQQVPYGESSEAEFGLVSSASLLNPSQKNSSFVNCRNFGASPDLSDRGSESQHSLRQFMDDWPKTHSDRSALSWPEIDMQSDRTQLSISIPMTSSSFISSSSSPTNEKVTLSPLRLSREFDPIQMGLGVGSVLGDQPSNRQANWIPISWETSMGGPLGEVLHNSNNNNVGDCKNSSALNLMPEGWDGSPRLGSSPTGVLQKATFGSLSNSSAGSSPRADSNKPHEGANLCNDLRGTPLVNSSSMPSL